MAQHFIIHEKDYPKVFKSIRNVIKDVFELLMEVKDFTYIYYAGKDIIKLSRKFNPDGLAFSIKPYQMNKKIWTNNNKDATLEVHVSLKGKLQKIYYPL